MKAKLSRPNLNFIRDMFLFSSFSFVALMYNGFIFNQLQQRPRRRGNDLETIRMWFFVPFFSISNN